MKLVSFNFVGDESLQLEYSPSTFGLFKVTDLRTALEALALIVDQGEGSNACNPQWVEEEIVRGLSHYYRFMSIVKGHEVRVNYTDEAPEVWFLYLLIVENRDNTP